MNKQKQPAIAALRYVIFNLLGVLIVIVPFIALVCSGKWSTENLLDNLDDFGILLVWFVMLFYQMFTFFSTSYYEENNSIVVETKFINIKKVVLPYEKINTINVKQTLIDKMLHTKMLMLDSGSTNTSNRCEFKIIVKENYCDYLVKYIDEKVKYAKQNKECDLEFPSDKKQYNQIIDTKNYDFEINNKELFKASLFKIEGSLVFAIFGTIFLICSVFLPLYVNNLDAFKICLEFTPLMLLGGFLIGYIYNCIVYYCKYYNYKITEDEKFIYVKFGYFTTKEYKLPKNKIQGAIIKQSFLQKIFGYYSPEIMIIGYGSSKEENLENSLFPNCNKELLNQILKKYIPQYSNEYEMENPKTDIKRFFYFMPILECILLWVSIMVGLYFVCFISYVPFITGGVLGLIGFILVLMDRYEKSKHNAIGINKGKIYLSNNGITNKIIITQRKNLQSVKLKSNIFRKRRNLNKLEFTVKANINDRNINILGYDSKIVDNKNLLKY